MLHNVNSMVFIYTVTVWVVVESVRAHVTLPSAVISSAGTLSTIKLTNIGCRTISIITITGWKLSNVSVWILTNHMDSVTFTLNFSIKCILLIFLLSKLTYAFREVIISFCALVAKFSSKIQLAWTLDLTSIRNTEGNATLVSPGKIRLGFLYSGVLYNNSIITNCIWQYLLSSVGKAITRLAIRVIVVSTKSWNGN